MGGAAPSPRVTVAVTLVARNDAALLPAALASLRASRAAPVQVVAVDNGSTDDTARLLAASSDITEVIAFPTNRGYTAGHNAAIAATSSDLVLTLDPDACLSPGYIDGLLPCFADPTVGMVTGKLLRGSRLLTADAGAPVIDSTGIVWTRNGRHLDRGAGEVDHGQYDRDEEVFGPCGAAAIYRRAMLEDVAVDGEIYDTDFETYRADADLAWRARLLGHRGLYRHRAVASHRRVVTPERRSALPPAYNAMSVRNRFLMRFKNEGAGLFVRNGPHELARDAMVVGYVLLAEWTSLRALGQVVAWMPRTLRKRAQIQRRRRVPDAELAPWFGRGRGAL